LTTAWKQTNILKTDSNRAVFNINQSIRQFTGCLLSKVLRGAGYKQLEVGTNIKPCLELLLETLSANISAFQFWW